MLGSFILLAILLVALKITVDMLLPSKKRARRQRYRRESVSRDDTLADQIGRGLRSLARSFGESRRQQHQVASTQPPQPHSLDAEQAISEIEVICPTCKSVLVAPPEMAGQDATCEGCRAIVHVPALPAMPASHDSARPPPTPEITITLLQELEWKRFEQVTEAYFERTGWRTNPARIGADGGVDIHLFRPTESNIAAVVQCKAWTSYKVGVKPVRELFGVMAAESVSEGYFVASGDYTEEARSFAHGKTLTLIDGGDLVERIRALSIDDRHHIYDIATTGDYKTPTCPRCGRKMVRRIGAKGRGVGVPFWGCPGYPRCKAILKVGSD